jgi:hypothetical protein
MSDKTLTYHRSHPVDEETVSAIIDRLEAAEKRVQELESLLGQWCHTRANAVGALTNHYPIDGSGRWVTEAEAWGCNSCGEGWPCFVARTLDLLATTPSSAEEPKQ